jgi:predicted DNA-binding transcriptional regulator YafY
MNRVDRLFGILIKLQSKKYVTAAHLADKFEISVRTVYRDIRALEELGIPVGFEQPKGYFIVQGYFLPPLSFTTEEANSLILMTALAVKFADKSIIKHSDSALSKIRAILKSADKDKSDRFSSHIDIHNPDPQKAENDYLIDIQRSITQQHIITIDYSDTRGVKTTRDIEPIGLVFYNLQWHLIAWCWMRNDYRDFIVNKILNMVSTNNIFRKNDHINTGDFLTWLK